MDRPPHPRPLVVPSDAPPAVQIEALKTFRSMQRWSAIKEISAKVVGVAAFVGFFAFTCPAVCG